jgi:hypothetical protein
MGDLVGVKEVGRQGGSFDSIILLGAATTLPVGSIPTSSTIHIFRRDQ